LPPPGFQSSCKTDVVPACLILHCQLQAKTFPEISPTQNPTHHKPPTDFDPLSRGGVWRNPHAKLTAESQVAGHHWFKAERGMSLEGFHGGASRAISAIVVDFNQSPRAGAHSRLEMDHADFQAFPWTKMLRSFRYNCDIKGSGCSTFWAKRKVGADGVRTAIPTGFEA
jgi:hypothetical protein